MLEFADGRWQGTPLSAAARAVWHGNKTGADTSTISLSLQPQADGTLRGTQTLTVLTDECGLQGNVYKTPVVATRTGDVPASVVLADPELFLS